MVRLVLAIALLLAALTVADEAKSDSWPDCNSDEPDRSIEGCTEIIKAKRTSKYNRAIAYYYRGNAYLDQSKYEWAISDYTQAIKLKPKHANAYHNRGIAYHRTGNYSQAIADYTTAIKLKPGYVGAFYSRGLAHENEPDYDLARRDYRKVLQLDPGHEKAKRALKRLAKSESKPRPVIKGLRSAPRAVSKPRPVIKGLRSAPRAEDACRGLKTYDGKISCLTKLIESGGLKKKDLAHVYKKLTNAYMFRGAARNYNGHHTAAIADYDRAIKLSASDSPSYLIYAGRAEAHSKLGQHEEVVADINEIFKIDPIAGIGSLGIRADAYNKMGDILRAVADYRIALEVSPDFKYPRDALIRLGVKDANYDGRIKLKDNDASGFIRRGITYSKKGEYIQAIAFYDIAIHLKPKEPAAYNNRGYAHFKKDDINKAIADYGEAIRLNPKYATAYGNRGAAFYKVGRIDRAIADFLKALDLDPSLEVVKNNLKQLEAQP